MTTPDSPACPGPAGSAVTYRRWRGLEDVAGMAAGQRPAPCARRAARADRPRRHAPPLHPPRELRPARRLPRRRAGRGTPSATPGWSGTTWPTATGSTTRRSSSSRPPGASASRTRWSPGAERRSRRARRREHPTDRRTWYSNYSFDGDTEARGGAARSVGYEAVRWDAEMLRPDLEDLPDGRRPRRLRAPRRPSDDELPAVFAMMVAGVRRALGRVRGERPALRGVGRRSPLPPRPRGRRLAGRPAGRVRVQLLETQPDGSRPGPLNGVCTHPGHRRRGLGQRRIAESLRLLRDEGATTAYLGVDTDNHNRALALYESCGFRRSRAAAPSTASRSPRGGRPMMHERHADIDPTGHRRRPGHPGPRPSATRPTPTGTRSPTSSTAPAAPTASTRCCTAENLAAEYADSETFKLDRDVLLAEVDGAAVGVRDGHRVVRGQRARARAVGRRRPRVPSPGIGTALHRDDPRPAGGRGAADPARGRELRSLRARASRRATSACSTRTATSRSGYGFEMRRSLTGALPELALPEGLEMRPVTPRTSTGRSSTPTTRRSGTTGATASPRRRDFLARFTDPDTDTSCGASPGTATRSPAS